MTARDRARLAFVHPVLVMSVDRILTQAAAVGHPLFVVEGVRTLERQRELYARGRTTKGPKVTNCDGVQSVSNHQVHGDGYGYAVDLAFDALEPFAESHPWAMVGELAKHQGLIWGGDFRSLPDRPHVELPRT